jgi:hypothetical protein
MRDSKYSGQPKATTRSNAKMARVKMKMHGLPIDIPPELDLPAGAPFLGADQPAVMRIPKDIQELFGPLIEMATNAWRLKVRMVNPETGEPREETSKLYRFVEGLFRALSDAGIQVIDKTGKPYNSGMSEKVVSFEQTPGLLREEIIDTVRPAIRWKEQPLYLGEIIVGIPVIETPQKSEPQPEAAPPPAEMDAGPAKPAETVAASADQGEPSRNSDNGSPAPSPNAEGASGEPSTAVQCDAPKAGEPTAPTVNPTGETTPTDRPDN